ncbi:carbon starvation protein CstA [Janibacter sp. Soil728]|uniref:carbon starvation CstA family protein n=1 Tax=Janibacter sp. Soil728 TaxID=1736393 RepID=UPI0007022E07|nr:carbon starvation CstA family protein [Janibacter sp. Soil728]KRE37854.1 carbon starvation protein CstA [Janibacter sp. Soil728]
MSKPAPTGPVVDAPEGVQRLRTDPDRPPVAVRAPHLVTGREKLVFALIGLLGAVGWVMIAVVRGEHVNAVWFVFAAVCTYIIGYRFYARLIEYKVIKPRDERATPAEQFENGKDFMPTDRRVLFGHHFAAIAGAGPLVGPVLAAQMGYLPGTLWIVFGVVFAGAVQDYMVLHLSIRRGGRSLGQMARDELGRVGGIAAIVGVLAIMLILIAVLGIVVIGALANSPWGVFSIAMTIPIALFMGLYLRFLRPGAIGEISLIGVVLLIAAIIGGGWVSGHPTLAGAFTLEPITLAWLLIGYGFAASVLPVWLLLAPRDYLSTYMKVGTIGLLAIGILVARPEVKMPAVTEFASTGAGPAFAGSLFPFLFITIACGALSGFHALISSGTTPKLIEKESQARFIGYGSMLTESFVAVMAMVAAVSIDQHIYFAMNAPGALTGGTPADAANYVNGLPLLTPSGGAVPPVDAATLQQAADSVGEETIISRTGGAPTLAFGMSEVMSVFGGDALKSFWYHFAVMFEALFILTTVDAGTRVARFMFSDALGNVPGLGRFKDPSWRPGAWLCSIVVVAGWGSILVMGILDPLGGIYTLFPLFGIANQLLAAIALAVVTTVVVKQGNLRWAWIPGIALVWDLLITLWASWLKIFSSDPKIGFFAQRSRFVEAREKGELLTGASSPGDMDKIIFNSGVQGTLSIIFAVLVIIVVAASVVVMVRAARAGGLPTSEDEGVPSRIFAPTGPVATAQEKAVLQEWKDAGLDPSPAATRGHG